jgi:Zn-dependent protease
MRRGRIRFKVNPRREVPACRGDRRALRWKAGPALFAPEPAEVSQMLLQVPARTPYDLNFRLLRFPVRVHPLFWLASLIMGWHAGYGTNVHRFLWVGCVFVSILVHELGHGLVARAFGARPEIVLHMLGGLCIYTGADRQSLGKRLAVLIAGPGAGFVLFALILLAGHVLAGLTLRDDVGLMGLDDVARWDALLKMGRNDNQVFIIEFLVFINLTWGLVNLLPVWPLDGGQMTEAVLTAVNPREGMRRALIVSIVVAAAIAAYSFLQREQFRAIFFGLLAANSLMTLQTLRQNRAAGFDDVDDADWWKR